MATGNACLGKKACWRVRNYQKILIFFSFAEMNSCATLFKSSWSKRSRWQCRISRWLSLPCSVVGRFLWGKNIAQGTNTIVFIRPWPVKKCPGSVPHLCPFCPPLLKMVGHVPHQFVWLRRLCIQGCGLGLDVSVSRRSRDVPRVSSRSRLGNFLKVSVSSRSRQF